MSGRFYGEFRIEMIQSHSFDELLTQRLILLIMSASVIQNNLSMMTHPQQAGGLCGENGTLEYTAEEVGDCLVAFFAALVRDLPDERLHELFMNCITSAKTQPRVSTGLMVDLFILAFQTRDCRGGKGERALFHKLFLKLHEEFPQTSLSLLPLISEYGSYKDYFHILSMLDAVEGPREGDKKAKRDELVQAIISLIVAQLKKDHEALNFAQSSEGEPVVASLSLCAKYCPRKGSAFHKSHRTLYKTLISAVIGNGSGVDSKDESEAIYRRLISRLTASLGVIETLMCAKQFSAIDFSTVPSLSMLRYRKAFLNEKVPRQGRQGALDRLRYYEEETGNRYPQDMDRVEARRKLRELVASQRAGRLRGERGVHGGQVYPHEIVHKLLHDFNVQELVAALGEDDEDLLGSTGGLLSAAEKELMDAQWMDMREKVRASITSIGEEREKGVGVRPGKLLPVVDVSGSMEGLPMEVAIALGILLSEVNPHPAFRDRLITFHSQPSWVSLTPAEGGTALSLSEKVRTVQRSPWGENTDLERVFALIETVIRAHRLPVSEVPDIVVFSDMQFDDACYHSEGERVSDGLTQLQRVSRRFHDLGVELTGSPYPRPRIVFWNLRGDTGGFPATASSDNVQMLSGYSPALFNALLLGESLPEREREAVVTPYSTMRAVLDSVRYDAVRAVLGESVEGCLSGYRYVKERDDGRGDCNNERKRRKSESDK